MAFRGGSYAVTLQGLEGLDEDLRGIPTKASKNAARAINKTAARYRTRASRAIREEVAFKARYLDNKESGRLSVGRQASASSLESTIKARFDPTSLARFVQGTPRFGKAGVRVRVKPGSTQAMGRAFRIQLANGNVGLAIRLRAGESLENKKAVVQSGRRLRGLAILYGPSVYQVFRSVAEDIEPEAAEYLETEFARLMELDLR